ncbi:helix-turn-helix domain-containing protein [Paenibacillus agaridevorans]|uniref:helix-turn-helix domain-containing protein n=1 Tax=Paenibacillus agaridevorans TaxID=171404 RepID=UPI001BE497DA
MDYSKWLKENRKKMNWSRETLADLLGVSKFTLRNWEDGMTRPNQYGQTRLKMVFGELPE